MCPSSNLPIIRCLHLHIISTDSACKERCPQRSAIACSANPLRAVLFCVHFAKKVWMGLLPSSKNTLMRCEISYDEIFN